MAYSRLRLTRLPSLDGYVAAELDQPFVLQSSELAQDKPIGLCTQGIYHQRTHYSIPYVPYLVMAEYQITQTSLWHSGLVWGKNCRKSQMPFFLHGS